MASSNPINRLKNQVNSLEYKLMKKQETIDKMNELLNVDEHERKTLLNEANCLQAFKNENNELKYTNNKLMEENQDLRIELAKIQVDEIFGIKKSDLIEDNSWLEAKNKEVIAKNKELIAKNKKLRIILEDSKKYKLIDYFRLFLQFVGMLFILFICYVIWECIWELEQKYKMGLINSA
jgi:hypothetical protein